jgi:hypothetical protein
MKVSFLNWPKSNSLTFQIREQERKVLAHRQAIPIHSHNLVRKIRLQMTSPGTLLLTSGIGFILAEVTQRQSPQPNGSADNSKSAETSPLITALNLFTTARTLYMALPIAWILKSSKQRTQHQVTTNKKVTRSPSKLKATADCT